jgi:hypothetical protein
MLLTLLVLLASLCAISAQLNDFFSPSELNARKTAAKKYLLEPSNSEEAYCHARVLQVTKAGKIDCDCNGLEKLVRSKVASPLDVYYGMQTAALCECKISPLKRIEDQIEEDLKSQNLQTFGGAALAAKITSSVLTPTTDDFIGRVTALLQPSGLFRSARTEVGSSSLSNTKFALEVLSQFTSDKPETSEVTATVTKLLTDVENARVSDPSLLAAIVKMTVGNKRPNLDGEGASPAERLSVISNGLLSMRHSSSACEVAAVVESLVVVQAYKAQMPLFVGLQESVFSFSKGAPKIAIQVKDAFGKDVPEAAVEVLALRKDGRDKPFKAPTGTLEGNVLDLKGQEADIVPGRYSVELSVIAGDRKQPMTPTVFFSVYAQLAITEVSVGINKKKELSDVDLEEIAEQNGWSDGAADASSNAHVHLAFAVSTPKKIGLRFQKPHQVFVKFSHQATGTSSFYVAADSSATYSGKGSGSQYSVSVPLSKEARTFLHLSGPYTVSIIAADPAFAAVEFVVGSVQLTFPAAVVEEPALYIKALLHTSDNTLKPLPEVEHRMRPPPKNAPAFMSVLFTALAIAPLVAFVGYVLSLKPNIKRMTSHWAVMFAVGIVGICLLYVLYWFTVPGFLFYDTIKYLCIAFPVMGVVGRSAVISLNSKSADSA